MLHRLLRSWRRSTPAPLYDTDDDQRQVTSGQHWIQFGRAVGSPPWSDRNIVKYPSQAAMFNDPAYFQHIHTEVARDMIGDQPASTWRRTWVEDDKALRNED